jgi:hypothetical protein
LGGRPGPGAGWNLVSAIPVAGYLGIVGKGGKYAGKAGDLARGLNKADDLGYTLGKAGRRATPGGITGYSPTTKTPYHGIDSAISHDGVGVAPKAILDAVRNPVKVIEQSGGRQKFVGKNATVVLNSKGEVITTWATSKAGWRVQP